MFDWMTQFDRFSLSPDNVPAAGKTQSELHKLFYSNAGTLVFKWRHYLKIYEDHLSRFRNTPFHMLEIGVAQAVRCRCGESISGPKPFCSGSILTIVAVSSINATLMYASVRKMILSFCDR